VRKANAPRADLPSGTPVRDPGPACRRECHARHERVTRHHKASPADTPAGEKKTVFFAGRQMHILSDFAGRQNLRSTNHKAFASSATPTDLDFSSLHYFLFLFSYSAGLYLSNFNKGVG